MTYCSYQKLNNKIMGAKCCSLFNVPDTILTLILKKAQQKHHYKLLQQNEYSYLNGMIEAKHAQTIQFQYCTVHIQFQSNNINLSQIDQQKSQIRLIVQSPDILKNKGLIINHNSYYIGKINNNTASGQGQMHFMNVQGNTTDHKITPLYIMVEGNWNSGKFKQGYVFEYAMAQNKKLFHIRSSGESVKILFFQNEHIRYFEGTINWINPSNLKEMMTGEGSIQFKNGSTYQGGIKNGLMDTQETGRTATFTTAGKEQIFEGHYREGLREGAGISTIKTEAMTYKYSMNWTIGQPQLSSMQLLDRNLRNTIYRMN